MADKKVDRSSNRRPLTPTQKMTAALSDTGTMDMADSKHNEGRSMLVDKFREREERWRRDQSLRDVETSREREAAHQETGENDTGDAEAGGEGGAS
jgi:hypothetical protein